MNGWDSNGVNVVVGAATTAFTAAWVATSKVDVLATAGVDWMFRPTNLGAVAITGLEALVQFSTALAPDEATDEDWETLQIEDLAATGIATLIDYQPRRAISGAAPMSRAFSATARGRWMRIKFRSTGGDPTNSVTAITAYRRK